MTEAGRVPLGNSEQIAPTYSGVINGEGWKNKPAVSNGSGFVRVGNLQRSLSISSNCSASSFSASRWSWLISGTVLRSTVSKRVRCGT